MIMLLACLRLCLQASCKRTEQLIAHWRGIVTLHTQAYQADITPNTVQMSFMVVTLSVCLLWLCRTSEELMLYLGCKIGYWRGDIKGLVDDIGEACRLIDMLTLMCYLDMGHS